MIVNQSFLTNAGIEEALADLPSDSDISCSDDDSVTDETWQPRDQQDAESSDCNISANLDVGPDGDGREDAMDDGLPDLDQRWVVRKNDENILTFVIRNKPKCNLRRLNLTKKA